MKKRLLSIILATTMISGNCLGVNAIETLPDEIIVVDSSENEESDEITMESGDAESEIIEESADEIPAEESAEDGSAASFDASYDEAEDTIEIVLEDEEADSASFAASFDASSEGSSKDPISDHPYSTGYRSLQKSYTSQSVKEGSEFGSSFYASEKDSLPSRYITPRLPDLEDQGNYGTCWAFSSISLAEISIMNQGLSGYISSEELSQLHLAYFSYNSVTDPLDGTYGDVNASGEYGSDVLDLGGNLLLSRNVFANWTGAADSATMPYSDADSIGSYRVNDSLCYQDAAHLKNYYEESYSVYDLSPIKSLIKKCGAVGISFYAESPYCGEINSIYSSNTNSYYNSECYWPNHAVTVVGWDDDYSADNFVVRPEGNGAWLVRNSWMSGKYDDPDSWCYDGYFWLSYYDHSIDTDVHAFEFDASDNYDNCYQYDGGMLNGETLAYKAANVFTAKGPLGSGGESLKAVSFYTSNSNVSYTVDIYTNLENPDDPESGEKCVEAETKGTTGYAGFYTVELNRPVFLPQDTTFSVVITLEKQDEYELYVGTELACRDWFIVETSAMQGQSFIKPFAEAEWTDYGLSENANVRIKAYTDNDTDGSVIAPSEISFENVGDVLEIGIYDNFRVRPSFSPSSTTSKKLIWTSEDNEIATVTDGMIYGVSKGETVITATSAENQLVAASFKVVVKEKLIRIGIQGDSQLEMGRNYQFEVFTVPSDMEFPGDVSWYFSDSKVLKVDSSGMVQPVNVGFAAVYAYCGEFSSKLNVVVCPESPRNLKASVDERNNIQVKWDCSKQADYFEIWRKTKNLQGEVLTDYELVGGFNAGSKKSFSYYDSNFKDDYQSKIVEYRVHTYKNGLDSFETVEVPTYSRINLEADGGILRESYVLVLPKYNEEIGTYENVAELPVPVKQGYSFKGWIDDEDQTLLLEDSSVLKMSNTSVRTLKAEWTPITYRIHFDANNGSATGSMEDMECKYGESYFMPECGFTGADGMTFVSWNVAADGNGKNYKVKQTISNLASEDGQVVTVYAQWAKVKYTVFFDSNVKNGGSFVAPVTVKSGEKLTKPGDPVREGFVFGGWFLAANDKGEVVEETVYDFDTIIGSEALAPYVSVDNEFTLFAKWTNQKSSIIESDIKNVVKTLALDKKSVKVGYGNSVTIRATTILPYTASSKISWEVVDKKSVLKKSGDDPYMEEGFDKYGVPYITVIAGDKVKGTATIIATAKGGKTAKCTISVGPSLSSLSIAGKGGAASVAAGKTLQMAATFNGGAKDQQPNNKDLSWRLINNDGDEVTRTDIASINAKGVISAFQEGIIRVRATSTSDVDELGKPVYAECEIAAYIPLKKAALSAKSIVLAPQGEYTIRLNLTPGYVVSGHENYVTGATYAENKDNKPFYSSSVANEVVIDETSKAAVSDYAVLNTASGLLTEDGSFECRIVALNKTTTKAIPIKLSFTPYGAKKATTLSFSLTVSDKPISKINLSAKKLTINRGSSALLSADITPVMQVGEESELIWTIPGQYTDYLHFEGSEDKYEVHTGATESEPNKVTIVAEDKEPLKKISAKVVVETKAKKANGKPCATATCTIALGNSATKIALIAGKENKTNKTINLAVNKSINLKAIVLSDDVDENKGLSELNKMTKATNQKVTWAVESSRDVNGNETYEGAIVTLNQSGKVTAVGNGTAIIKATSTDVYIAPTCSRIAVKVYTQASKITLDKTSTELQFLEDEEEYEGDWYGNYDVITPTITPSGAYENLEEFSDNGRIVWKLDGTTDAEKKVSLYKIATSELVGIGSADLKHSLVASRITDSDGGTIITEKGESLVVKGLSVGKVKIIGSTEAVDSKGKALATATCTVNVVKAKEPTDVTKTPWSEENIPEVPIPEGEYVDVTKDNNTDYVAIPDDGMDDTRALRAIIKDALWWSRDGRKQPVDVYVPAGVYNISIGIDGKYDDYGISIDLHENGYRNGVYATSSGLNLIMDKNAIFKVSPTNKSDYAVIAVRGGRLTQDDSGKCIDCNVTIRGGQIYGEREEHYGTGGEGGHGVSIDGAANVTIEDMRVYQNWGDGIYVGTRAWYKTQLGCRNITIRRCEIQDNRRNNISVIDLGIDEDFNKGLLISDCYFHDAKGTSPQAALCIEPNSRINNPGLQVPSEFTPCEKIYLKNTILESCKPTDNNSPAVLITAGNTGYVAGKNVKFENCEIKGAFRNESGVDVDRNYKPVTTNVVTAKKRTVYEKK